jgi:sulfite reductase (NADPH) flavoprotein alpha-component
LQAQTDTSLTNLSFSLLALGDTNYEHFCGFGKKVDSRLEELGAKRIFERIDCNVDFVEGASRWQKGVFEAVSKINGAGEAQPLNGSSAVSANGSAKPVTEKKEVGCSRKNPFLARLLVNRELTGEGSEKDTRHYEICLQGPALRMKLVTL